MRMLPAWVREFVDVAADDRQLAEDLTSAGIAVESVVEENGATVYEMDLTTNRVDAMNHYGVAREASAIYTRAKRLSRSRWDRRSSAPAASGPPPVGMTNNVPNRNRRCAGLCAIQRARCAQCQDRPIAAASCEAPGAYRLTLHQQRRRRHELRAQRAWPSDARVRSRSARRRDHHCAPRARGRSAEDARWRRTQARRPTILSSPTPESRSRWRA